MQNLKIIRNFVLGWTIALGFWFVLRDLGQSEAGLINNDFFINLVFTLIFGPLAGLCFGLTMVRMERFLKARLSLRVLIGTILCIQSIVLLGLISLAYLFSHAFQLLNTAISLFEFLWNPNIVLLFFYCSLVNFGILFFWQISLMIGGSNLNRILNGSFLGPTEEERIFMFIDMRSSTAIAEEQGHEKYSHLIQNCFYDLRVISEFGAEVYKYVGDEAIISWKIHRDFNYLKCIDAFFAFEEQLESRGDYYMQHFGSVPEFKAAVHAGKVMVAEIGYLKREIAYHGDILNTTARIEGLCNQFGESLLVSRTVYERIRNVHDYRFKKLKALKLMGKQYPLDVFSVALT